MPTPPVLDAKEFNAKLKDLIMNGRTDLHNMYGRREAESHTSLQMPIQKGEEITRNLVPGMGFSYEVADLFCLSWDGWIGDSGSMIHEKGGKRKETLIRYVDGITEIYSMSNEAGVLALRFTNTSGGKKHWTRQSRQYLDQDRKKVVGERQGHLQDVIPDCPNKRAGARKGFGAVAFQLLRIGSDSGVARLLRDLDQDPIVREYIGVLPVESDLEQQMEDMWFVVHHILLFTNLIGLKTKA
ncbi:hypothetical protein HOY80DRAFT_1021395 [Tuber brumale]|nr:hypothetical protein HOY80DRAFT_1021395 [Tuber brumale]